MPVGRIGLLSTSFGLEVAYGGSCVWMVFILVANIRVLSFYTDRVYDPTRRKDIFLSVQERSVLPGSYCLVAVRPKLSEVWLAEATAAEEVIGTADVSVYDMKGMRSAPPLSDGEYLLYVSSMAVLPEYRRRGVGQALLRYVFQLSWKLGVPDVFLHVSAEDNPPAVELYRSMSFKFNVRSMPAWIDSHARAEHKLLHRRIDGYSDTRR